MTKSHVLIIGGSEEIRHAQRQILDHEGYCVAEAAGGSDGLLRLRESESQLLILNAPLPDMDGSELCSQLKSDPALKHVPILFTATHPFPESNHGPNCIADLYLITPCQPVVLVAAVRSLIRLQSAERERDELAIRSSKERDEFDTANRAKDEFLATLSHELRTPLTAIMGWARLMRMDKLDRAQVTRGLDVIDRNVALQTQLIEDLLDVSRIISGKLVIRSSKIEPAQFVSAAIDSVTTMAAAKQIELRRKFEPCGDLVGDRNRLQQVVWNLLTNAIKFTPAGGVVEIALAQETGIVRITVTDQGAGIEPAFLPHVFDRFRQADTREARKHGGLGLGLAIVKQLVEFHSGKVSVKSPGLGLGASFTIELPIRAVDDSAEDKPAPDPNLDGVRAMVVEDDDDSRELITLVLERAGAHVTTARSAEQAFEVLDATRQDVIISDISMPHIDGYAMLRRARVTESSKSIPALALTAFSRSEDRQHALDAGFQEHLSKPIEPEKLVSAVLRVLEMQPG